MENNVTWISKEKYLVLRLESVTVSENDIMTAVFTFRDRLNNVYKHYQKAPSVAASKSAASKFFRGISNGKVTALDYTDLENITSDFKPFIGNYYSCVVRKKTLSYNGKSWSYYDVERLLWNCPVEERLYNEVGIGFLSDSTYVEDRFELNRIKVKYSKKV